MLCPINKDVHDIQQRLADFCAQVNYILARFGHLSHIIYLIIIAFRYMDHNYGDCIRQDCDFEIARRKSVRRIWQLPYRGLEHTICLNYYLLSPMADCFVQFYTLVF